MSETPIAPPIEDPLIDAPHETDLGNSRRFVNDWRTEIRYVPPWKAWLVWDGRRWQQDDTGQAVERAKKTVLAIYREASYAETPSDRERLFKHAKRSEAAARITAMLELARSAPGIPIDANTLDADAWRLAVANGTLDLRTNEMHPHTTHDLSTKLLPVPYVAGATCPRWLAFLDEIMAGKTDLVRFLQKAIGYTLTGDTREQVFFILWGAGANGKSTFLKAISALFGDYARQASMDTFMQKQNDSIPNDLARLHGVRFVAASEAEQQKRLAEALIKSLTGGDAIVARFLHKEFFEFTPRFKIFLATNHKPSIRGSDHAIWRRIRLIPFTVTIPDERQDKNLLEALVAELPGILAWAVEGCRLWREEGLGLPDDVKIAIETYRSEMDSIGAFLRDRCEVGAPLTAMNSSLYDAYTKWAQASGERAMSQRTFSMALAERGFEADRTGSTRFWRGLAVVENGAFAPSREPGEDSPDVFTS